MGSSGKYTKPTKRHGYGFNDNSAIFADDDDTDESNTSSFFDINKMKSSSSCSSYSVQNSVRRFSGSSGHLSQSTERSDHSNVVHLSQVTERIEIGCLTTDHRFRCQRNSPVTKKSLSSAGSNILDGISLNIISSDRSDTSQPRNSRNDTAPVIDVIAPSPTFSCHSSLQATFLSNTIKPITKRTLTPSQSPRSPFPIQRGMQPFGSVSSLTITPLPSSGSSSPMSIASFFSHNDEEQYPRGRRRDLNKWTVLPPIKSREIRGENKINNDSDSTFQNLHTCSKSLDFITNKLMKRKPQKTKNNITLDNNGTVYPSQTQRLHNKKQLSNIDVFEKPSPVLITTKRTLSIRASSQLNRSCEFIDQGNVLCPHPPTSPRNPSTQSIIRRVKSPRPVK